MSHHLIDISAPSCAITCRQGQLICQPKDGPERAVPMEDVSAVLISSFSAVVHGRVFLEAAQRGTVIIFCENFRPTSILLPANRSTDTALTRAQVELSPGMRKTLWQKTVTAKCMNQAALAREMAASHPATRRLASAAASQRIDKESRCARFYWSVMADRLELERFRRKRDGGGFNGLLNYGYGVLLARVLQKAMAVGIDPTFGIGHAARERATPLAYDVMEPFRVAVDARIVQWVEKLKDNLSAEAAPSAGNTPEIAVTPEFSKRPVKDIFRARAICGKIASWQRRLGYDAVRWQRKGDSGTMLAGAYRFVCGIGQVRRAVVPGRGHPGGAVSLVEKDVAASGRWTGRDAGVCGVGLGAGSVVCAAGDRGGAARGAGGAGAAGV